MIYYLGIDGGGTSTTFTIVNSNFTKIEQYETSTCHYAQVGIQNFSNIIKAGYEALKKRLLLSDNDTLFTFAAVPGYGEDQEAKDKMDSVLSSIFCKNNYRCGNDVLAGYTGALGFGDGINILAGTGSLAYGKHNMQVARAGGWGPLCGDEGSAYWIGKELIYSYAKQSDGRAKKGLMYSLIKKRLNLKDDFEIIEYLNSNNNRTEIAKLALLVTEAALQDDKGALEIYDKAARELSLQIKAVLQRLKFSLSEQITVSYSGGVFSAGKLILSPLAEELSLLNNNIVLKKPLLNPSLGAVALAASQHIGCDNKIIESLLKLGD